MCTQVAEALAKRPDAPKCVVAARPELETGAAARLLRELSLIHISEPTRH